MEFEIVEWANKIIERLKLKLKGDLQPALLVGYIDADGAIKRLNVDTFVVDPGGGAGIMKVASQGTATVQQFAAADRLNHYEGAEARLKVEQFLAVSQNQMKAWQVPIMENPSIQSSSMVGDGSNDKSFVINAGAASGAKPESRGFEWICLYMDTSAGVAKLVDVAVDLYWSNTDGAYTRFAQLMPETATHHHPQPMLFKVPHRYIQAKFTIPANGDVCTITGLSRFMKWAEL